MEGGPMCAQAMAQAMAHVRRDSGPNQQVYNIASIIITCKQAQNLLLQPKQLPTRRDSNLLFYSSALVPPVVGAGQTTTM